MLKKVVFVIFSPLFIYSQDYLHTNLLFNWNDQSFVGSSAYDNVYNEVWGFVKNNKEFAVIGSTEGTHIFDVTDPTNSTQVSFVEGRAQGVEIIHRDYHDYRDFLYVVCDEGQSSLQIIDISNLPDTAFLVYDSDSLFVTAHNIFIDTLNARLYTSNGTLYSLEDPVNPSLIYEDLVLKCHDMYVRNDTAYINSGNSFVVADFSQTSLENQTHVEIGSLINYSQQGYNHSGWLTEDGNYYVMADENWGLDMKMLDVSDLSNIEVISFISSNIDENSIPHNQIIKGDFLYTAYYHDGLYVHNISNPYYPYLVAFYDTFEPDHHDSYMGAWGVYPFLPSGNVLVSDMQTGLYVLEIDFESVDVKDLKHDLISVFPNPASDFISFNIDSPYSYTIFDMQSHVVAQESLISQNKISINNLQSGIYILKINTTNKIFTHKLIKK